MSTNTNDARAAMQSAAEGLLFGQQVRVRKDARGEPWFVAKDVCDILGISKYRDAISRLGEDEGCLVIVDTPGGPQEMTAVAESGLYHLIFMSRKPVAAEFRRWVTKELLPAIRREGFYAHGAEGLEAARMRAADYMALRGIAGSVHGFGQSAVAACRKLGLAFEHRPGRGHRYPVAALDQATGRRAVQRGPICPSPAARMRSFMFWPGAAESEVQK